MDAIGDIVGKHFAVRCPPNTRSVNFNYKNFYSVQLLAVVDVRCRFTIVDIGAARRQFEGGIFRRSNIGKGLKAKSLHIPQVTLLAAPQCLLGDKTVPSKPYLMHRFPRSGITTDWRMPLKSSSPGGKEYRSRGAFSRKVLYEPEFIA